MPEINETFKHKEDTKNMALRGKLCDCFGEQTWVKTGLHIVTKLEVNFTMQNHIVPTKNQKPNETLKYLTFYCAIYTYTSMLFICVCVTLNVAYNNEAIMIWIHFPHNWPFRESTSGLFQHKGLVMWSCNVSFVVRLNKPVTKYSSCQRFE